MGAGLAGALLGAMLHSQAVPEQQACWQTFTSFSCTQEALETAAPVTCAIRKMAAVMILIQACLMGEGSGSRVVQR